MPSAVRDHPAPADPGNPKDVERGHYLQGSEEAFQAALTYPHLHEVGGLQNPFCFVVISGWKKKDYKKVLKSLKDILPMVQAIQHVFPRGKC